MELSSAPLLCAFKHAVWSKVLEHAGFQTWRQPASTRLTFPAAIFPSWTFRPVSRRMFWSEILKATLVVSLMRHKQQTVIKTGEQLTENDDLCHAFCFEFCADRPLLAMDTNSQQTPSCAWRSCFPSLSLSLSLCHDWYQENKQAKINIQITPSG